MRSIKPHHWESFPNLKSGYTLWNLIIEVINRVKINETFTRQDLLKDIRKIINDRSSYTIHFLKSYDKSIDSYRICLTRAGFLETTNKRGVYKKIEHIPEDLITSKVQQYNADKTWRKWFIPREDFLGIKEKNNDRRNPM